MFLIDTEKFGEKVEKDCEAAARAAIDLTCDNLSLRKGQLRRALHKHDWQVETELYWNAYQGGAGIDPDRLREILEIILEFIRALLTLFNFSADE